MTTKEIPLEDLRIGMFIMLDLAWYEHPFLKNHFSLSSEDEIRKIKALGLKSVKIDTARSLLPPKDLPGATSPVPTLAPPPQAKEGGRPDGGAVPDDLLAVLNDRALLPERKARLLRQHSFTMMRNLFEEPTAENIEDVKRGTSEIVDLILRDDETTFYLINITDHDYYTYTHSVSVGFLAIALAKSVFRNSDHHDLHALGAGFFLHDLGKTKIDLGIINKPCRLTESEMDEMKQHPGIGFFLLQDAQQMTNELRLIVLQHHEKLNGTGYPERIGGEQIHVYGRLCAIADIFDALTSKRPYRERMPSFAALKLMKEEMMPFHIQKDLFEKFVLLFKAP